MRHPDNLQTTDTSAQLLAFAIEHELCVRIESNVRPVKGPALCLALGGATITAIEAFRAELAQRFFVGLEVSDELVARAGCVDVVLLPKDLAQGSLLAHHSQLSAMAESTARHLELLVANVALKKPLPIEQVIKDKSDRLLLWALSALKESELSAAVVIGGSNMPLSAPEPDQLVTCRGGKPKEAYSVNALVTGIDIGRDSSRFKINYSQWVLVHIPERQMRDAISSPHSLTATLKYDHEWTIDRSKPWEIYKGQPDPAKSVQPELAIP